MTRDAGCFDAWTICGWLTTCEDKLPIAVATIHAFDADWIQDDPLGSGGDRWRGRFRIVYTTADFRLLPSQAILNNVS
jgi:hypothetical protein